MARRRARLAAAVACAIGALLLAGCHASATVAIRMRADGRGTVAITVTLDRSARLALAGASLRPGASAPDVPLDDLRAAGWTVSPWKRATGGGATVDMSKGFVGQAGLAAVLAEIDGPDGAVRDPQVVRDRALLNDRDGISVLVDLTHLRVGVADDAALVARLRAAGIDVAALDTGLQSRVKGAFDLNVRLQLPDGSDTTAHLVPGQQHRVAIERSVDHPGRRAALVAAGAAAFLGLALLVLASFRARRARRARRGP